MLKACRIEAYIVRLAHIPNHLRQVHKSAYAEFFQDGGRQLKSCECYFDISSQLYAVKRQKYEVRYSISDPNCI